MDNLNEASIRDHNRSLEDYSIKSPANLFDDVEVVFRGLEDRLVEMIQAHKAQSIGPIFGSVAWLTSRPILRALQDTPVSIVVQKEDFLRPDYGQEKKYAIDFNEQLRLLYDRIESGLCRYYMQGILPNVSTNGGISVDGIRCVGNYNREKKPASPRAHHKFLVFCKAKPDVSIGRSKYSNYLDYNVPEKYGPWGEAKMEGWNRWYWPYAVWTGSFNFTHNGTRSLENAVILTSSDRDNPVLNGYMMEHHQLYAISEPLNWHSEWMEPEYRIGT
jgi:hypothetical protein